MNDIKTSALNSMMGLAIGEALSWPAMFHRSYQLPFWTRRIRREIDAASETDNVIVPPIPFSLNQPADNFNISPTVNSEWAYFAAELITDSNTENYKNSLAEEWKKLAESESAIKGSVSVQATLNNFRKGIYPPQSGKQNPHYFDDSAFSRAVPIGILCAGDTDQAVKLAFIDASVTNSEDGIWGAQAVAAAVASLCAGERIEFAVDNALAVLPESSWIRRTADEALSIADKTGDVFSALPELHNNIVNREYSYGNAAPETLAIALAILKHHGADFKQAVTLASSFAKCAQTLPAVTGALAGAFQTNAFASKYWIDSIKYLKGICIPALAGKDYLMISEKLSNMAGQK